MIFVRTSESRERRKYKWSRRERIFLLEQLEMYVSAGLPVSDSLKIMGGSGQTKKGSSIMMVCEEVESGGLLSSALRDNAGLSKSLTSIVEHGEKVGGLSAALKSAHDLLVKEDELIKKCLSAMTYPVVISLFAIFLTIGLMRGVVPQIVPMLTSMKVGLPILTKITIWLSGAIVSYGVYFLIVVSLKIFLAGFLYRKFLAVKKLSHFSVLFVPIVGKLTYTYSLSIFLRSFGTLVSSGIPIVVAFSEVVAAISFLPLRSDLERKVADISGGLPLQNIFNHKKMPPHVSALVSAGERSGSLGESLIRAANIIDADLENTLKRLTSLIEPLMMVGVGGVVGAIALSIMMPIYDMSKVLQHVR